MKKPPEIDCKTCEQRENSVFCKLSNEHLEAMKQSKTTNVYKPHQVIFYEGNQPFGLYCIKEGKIKIYKMDANGHQQIVRLLGPGDLVGYRCLLAGETYTATAETITESIICFIDKNTFLNVLAQDSATASCLFKAMAVDLRHAEDQNLNLVHKNVRERLAELFLTFRLRFGQKTTEGVYLDISLTREELAEMIGTTQESVIRLISEFKQDGLIHVDGRKITLLQLEKLSDVAGIVD